jgi:hypothetical protein
MVAVLGPVEALPCYIHSQYYKHNRSGMVAVLGPVEALPCYVHSQYYALSLFMLWVTGGQGAGISSSLLPKAEG